MKSIPENLIKMVDDSGITFKNTIDDTHTTIMATVINKHPDNPTMYFHLSITKSTYFSEVVIQMSQTVFVHTTTHSGEKHCMTFNSEIFLDGDTVEKRLMNGIKYFKQMAENFC